MSSPYPIVADVDLIRYGPTHDGGYVVPKVGLGFGYPNTLTLNQILTNHPVEPGDCILLKIDCEGGEWGGRIQEADLTNVAAIMIEMHGLANRHLDYPRGLVMTHLEASFDYVNYHENNYGRFWDEWPSGEKRPDVIEVTMINKLWRPLCPGVYTDLNYPNDPMDS
jgi:hypothetical protein